jgi:hypothetical protein
MTSDTRILAGISGAGSGAETGSGCDEPPNPKPPKLAPPAQPPSASAETTTAAGGEN